MKVIAHRGASFDAPENTLAALQLAWEQGADGAEIDVRLSRDRQILVIHDATLRRTAGRRAAVRRLSAREVRVLDAGSWKGARWAGEKVPLLEEVLSQLPAGKLLFVEIKCGAEIIAPLRCLLDRVKAARDRVALVGFSLCTMRLVKEAFPDQEAVWNVSLRQRREAWLPEVSDLLRAARQARMDGLGPGMCAGVNQPFLTAARAAGMKLFVWTVDDPAAAARLEKWGVDYLVTNRPGPVLSGI